MDVSPRRPCRMRGRRRASGWAPSRSAHPACQHRRRRGVARVRAGRDRLVSTRRSNRCSGAARAVPRARLLLARLGANRTVAGGRYDGMTAAMAAAARGRVDALTLLLENAADLELRDASGWTALMHAVHGQRPDCVKAPPA